MTNNLGITIHIRIINKNNQNIEETGIKITRKII
jgi:hypothetical protein